MTYFSILEHILITNLTARGRRFRDKNSFGAKIQIFKFFCIDFNKSVVEENFCNVTKIRVLVRKLRKLSSKLLLSKKVSQF